MMQVNPMQLISMIRNGQNPQQLMMNILEQRMGGNPMGQQLMGMVKNNDMNGLEQYARNICKSQGLDFDKEFATFKQQMGLK